MEQVATTIKIKGVQSINFEHKYIALQDFTVTPLRWSLPEKEDEINIVEICLRENKIATQITYYRNRTQLSFVQQYIGYEGKPDPYYESLIIESEGTKPEVGSLIHNTLMSIFPDYEIWWTLISETSSNAEKTRTTRIKINIVTKKE
jgi:hypothetical protein